MHPSHPLRVLAASTARQTRSRAMYVRQVLSASILPPLRFHVIRDHFQAVVPPIAHRVQSVRIAPRQHSLPFLALLGRTATQSGLSPALRARQEALVLHPVQLFSVRSALGAHIDPWAASVAPQALRVQRRAQSHVRVCRVVSLREEVLIAQTAQQEATVP